MKIKKSDFSMIIKQEVSQILKEQKTAAQPNIKVSYYPPDGIENFRTKTKTSPNSPVSFAQDEREFPHVKVGSEPYIYKWDEEDINAYNSAKSVSKVGFDRRPDALGAIGKKAIEQYMKYKKLQHEFGTSENAQVNLDFALQGDKSRVDSPFKGKEPENVAAAALANSRLAAYESIVNSQKARRQDIAGVNRDRSPSFWEREDANIQDMKRYNAMMQKRRDKEELEKRRAAAVDALRPGETSRSSTSPTRVAPAGSLQRVKEEINPIFENYFKQNLNENPAAAADRLAIALARSRDKDNSTDTAIVDIKNIPYGELEKEKEAFRTQLGFRQAVIGKIKNHLSGIRQIQVIDPDISGTSDSDSINMLKQKFGATTATRGVGNVEEEISLGQIVADEVNKAVAGIPEIKLALNLISEQDDASSQFTQELTNLIQKYGREIGMQVMGALEVDPEEEQTDLQAKISDVMANLGIQNT